MFVKTKSLLGVDVGTAMVKAIEFTVNKDAIEITGYASVPIAGVDNAEPALKKILDDARFSAKKVSTAISGRKVVVRYVPLDNGLAPQAVKAYVDEQAQNYIPFELEQVEKDFYPVTIKDAAGNATSKAILVAARKEEIEARVNALRKVGLVPFIIDIDTFALGNAFELWAGNNNLQIDGKVIALVDIGNSKTTINIMQCPVSNFSREVYIGTQDMKAAISKRFNQSLEEAEQHLRHPEDNYDTVRDAFHSVLEDIGNEIRLSIDFYENQFEAEVSEIYVSGGITKFPGLVEILGQIFYLPTNAWNPVQNIRVAKEVDTKRLNDDAAMLAVAVGLASRIKKV